MSDLEKARAGVFLSLLAFTLTWLLNKGNDSQSRADAVNPIVLCATTHGAVCDVTTDAGPEQAASLATQTAADTVHLGEIVVSDSRLPTDLGHMVVSATRLPEEPFAKARLAKMQPATAKREREDSQSIVVQ